MSIRRLLVTLLALLGLLTVIGSVWETREARQKMRAVSWIEQSNLVADIALRAGAVMAMERGITAAIVSNPHQAGIEMLDEMRHQRHALDQLYQQLLHTVETQVVLPANHPVSAALIDLAASRGELETIRQQTDRLLRDGPAVSEQQWLNVATRHIELLAEVRRATMAPLPDNAYSYVPNPLIKEVLFTISEFAGRERAIVGTAIAANRALTEAELLQLQQYRDMVEMALRRSEALLRQFAPTPQLAEANAGLASNFLGSYQELRLAVHAASREGTPYPVTAREWYSEATRGINSVLALTDALSDQLRNDVTRLRHQANRGTALVMFSLLLAAVIFVTALILIRTRILRPLQRLETAVDTVSAGQLEQPLPRFNEDELGHFAHSFDQMRQALLADRRQREHDASALRKFSFALDQSADSVIITDRHRVIEYVNAAFERTRGYRLQQVIGKNAAMFKSELNAPELYRSFQQALERGDVFRATLMNRRADGSTYYEEVTVSPVRNDVGAITHYISTGKDVTQRILAERELHKLSLAIEQSGSSVIITNVDGVVEYVNLQFSHVTGYAADEIVGRKFNAIRSGRTSQEQYRSMWETIMQGAVWEGELMNKRKNGELYWERVSISPVRDEQGVITHFIGLQHDISERKMLEEQLNFYTYYDELTQLPNRTLLFQRFAQVSVASRRSGTLLALLSLDISRFKLINDSLGHRIGDQVLRTVGRRLNEVARGQDTVARYGGDEFVILLSGVQHIDDVSTITQRIIDAVARPMTVEGHELRLSLHVGISVMPRDGDDLDTLLRNAVTALHHASHEGRNHFRFYTEELNLAAQERLSLEHALRRALELNELELHYQPKVNLRSGEIVGVEALARWQHPTEGWISPERFIPVAEETGLIQTLGEWALREACRQNRHWQELGLPAISVAVNLSAYQLRQPSLALAVARVLEETGLEPRWLELELTETAVMDSPRATAETLQRLKALGVTLAVDDFGTGYSSLSHLSSFPFDTLKIDRSFVADIIHAPDQATIAMTIIAMASSLRLRVIAEGVETEAQAVYLRDKGCDELQGYLFSRPLPAPELELQLRRSRRLVLSARDDERALNTVLLLGDEPEELAALRRLLQQEGYHVLALDSVNEAFDMLALHGAGVVISGQCLAHMSGIEFLQRIRDIYPDTIRFLLSGDDELKTLVQATDSGVIHDHFRTPWDEATVRETVRKAFRLNQTLHARMTE